MGLKAKFNLVMLVAFVIGLLLAGALSYQLTRFNARREVMSQAALMTQQAAAISDYTVNEISPLLSGHLKTRFLPQIIPFAASQAIFRIVQVHYPQYSYRNTANNPTNPDDSPTDWQAAIINDFKSQPNLSQLVTERDTPAGRLLSVSRPIQVNDPGCLECHSTPAAAPPSMVDLYGEANGFGWHLGDIVGAEIVTAPMNLALEQARKTFYLIMIGLVAVFSVIAVVINLLLHFLVIRPVRQVSSMAAEVSLGNLDAPEHTATSNDEIGSLAESFNRMRRSLTNAMHLLEG